MRLTITGSLAAALLLAAPVARAAGGGSVWAGPSRASGSALPWNPAALAGEAPGLGAWVDLTGWYLGAGYQRQPEDAVHEPRYDPVGFQSVAPDLSFVLQAPTPSDHVRVLLGGYSPVGSGVAWPADGPQRYHATQAYAVGYALGAGLLLTPAPWLGLAALAGPTYYRVHLQYALDFGAFIDNQMPAGAGPFGLEDPTLRGTVTVDTSGWSWGAMLGAFARPASWCRLGVGFTTQRDANLEGKVDVVAPPLVHQALPDFRFEPRGRVHLRYPMPWQLGGELELEAGDTAVALTFQYVRARVQRHLFGSISNADPAFLAGPQVTVKETQDAWTAATRVSRRLGEELALGLRVALSPRNVPTEAVSPVNLSFTTIEAALGARWSWRRGRSVTLTYAFIYAVPVHVTWSIYDPRAPASSGLSAPSARGDYTGQGHRLVLGLDGLWD
jgi:hypothetical protein